MADISILSSRRFSIWKRIFMQNLSTLIPAEIQFIDVYNHSWPPLLLNHTLTQPSWAVKLGSISTCPPERGEVWSTGFSSLLTKCWTRLIAFVVKRRLKVSTPPAHFPPAEALLVVKLLLVARNKVLKVFQRRWVKLKLVWLLFTGKSGFILYYRFEWLLLI